MKKNSSMLIALNLLIKIRGLTQAEIGERAGMSSSQLSRYLQGGTQPGFKQVVRLLKALDCNLVTFAQVIELVETLGVMLNESDESRAKHSLLLVAELRSEVTVLKNQFLELQKRLSQLDRVPAESSSAASR